MKNASPQLLDHLTALYGAPSAKLQLSRLRAVLANYPPSAQSRLSILTHRDSILITYGDQIRDTPRPPLRVLTEFCNRHLKSIISGIHLLPFYPYTSDDGFSVTDYRDVDPALGDWVDINRLGANFRLMFDAVINHISAHSHWFKAFRQGDTQYSDWFITADLNADLSAVVRPRALPLLTPFETANGVQHVWTTFSADQIDLNFRNPEVLLEIIDLLLFYASRGAELIRLDAIAYLWKEIGTSCIHLPQTHRIIQLFRTVLNEAAPQVQLITETNVPHTENLSYFGDGNNEAQLVYNFALPPLTLHTLRTGNATALSRWAQTLQLPSRQTTFFNFLASHDGIGLNPVRGILPQPAIDALVSQAQSHGGLISYKNNADGTRSPYEMNINYFDALSNPDGSEPTDLQIDRFMASQAIMLAIIGVPGIYFHSLFGSRGWREGARQSGHNRTINRQKLALPELQKELADKNSLRARVFKRYRRLLKARAASPAFDPFGEQQVIDCGDAVFALLRTARTGERTLCLQNVTAEPVTLSLLDMPTSRRREIKNILSGRRLNPNRTEILRLKPYQTMWLEL